MQNGNGEKIRARKNQGKLEKSIFEGRRKKHQRARDHGSKKKKQKVYSHSHNLAFRDLEKPRPVITPAKVRKINSVAFIQRYFTGKDKNLVSSGLTYCFSLPFLSL